MPVGVLNQARPIVYRASQAGRAAAEATDFVAQSSVRLRNRWFARGTHTAQITALHANAMKTGMLRRERMRQRGRVGVAEQLTHRARDRRDRVPLRDRLHPARASSVKARSRSR